MLQQAEGPQTGMCHVPKRACHPAKKCQSPFQVSVLVFLKFVCRKILLKQTMEHDKSLCIKVKCY